MQVGVFVSGGVDNLKRVDTALLSSVGFRAVFVACFEDEVRWRAEEIAAFVRRARTAGLEPYAVPWGYGRLLAPAPSIDSLYLQVHADTSQIDSRGRRVRRACPNDPRFLEWFSSSVRTLAWLLECRGFVWDEPGFHHGRGGWSCRCGYCKRLFAAAYGHEMPRELTDEVLQFRRHSLSMFILAAAAAIQSVDRRLQSLVVPSPRLGREQWYSGNEDLGLLAQCAGVDGLCMPVPWQEMGWDMEYGLREVQKGAAGITHAHQKGCAVWLTASPRPSDRTVDAIEYAARVGTDAVILSDYGSLVAAPGFSAIQPALTDTIAQLAAGTVLRRTFRRRGLG